MKNNWFTRILAVLAIAVGGSLFMMLLGSLPPLSFLVRWLYARKLEFLWKSLVSGLVACLIVMYLNKTKR